MNSVIKRISFGAFLLFALPACRYIDEDMASCAKEFELEYEMRLVTNMTTELETKLSIETDVAVAASLRTYLENVFTDRAHDVDLSFYDVFGDSLRLHHERHIMDATQSSYTLNIPVRRYMHVGLANLEDNRTFSLENDERCHRSRLQQQVADTLGTQRHGVFTARLPMDIKAGVDQEFNVSLYMANSATALVLDTLDSHIKDIRVYATGFATAFDVTDSLYRFQYSPIIRADQLEVKEDPRGQLCFATVNFPSRGPETKAEEEKPVYWEYRVYSYLKDGTITETKLSITHPLEPAQLDILKAKVYGDGALEPSDVTVGVSVSLDWKPGMQHEVII